MTRKFKYCAACGRNLTEREISRGLFVEAGRDIHCATCAQKMDELEELEARRVQPDEPSPPPAPDEPDPPAEDAPADPAVENGSNPGVESDPDHIEILSGIKEQMETIHRTILFEKTSFWNVIGGVTQILAVGFMVAAGVHWLEDPMNFLLVALVFQVMALAFFVKGK